ncbi:probable Long-chain-fatty-acid--CoA ligase 1 [Zygosaccharomyces bailii ISA1307]|nr:probable Long-chain-fatty-acid--CoA ligase 1 [Zygosaccharomyces bailii ISA1307]
MTQFTVEVGKAANPHETAPRRNRHTAKAALKRPLNTTCNTVYEFALECFTKRGDAPAMAWRDMVDIHAEKKMVTKKVDGKDEQVEKTWNYFELTPYHGNTYNELTAIMHNVGRGLVKMGLEPNGVDKLHIYAATSHKWMKTFLAAQSQSIPVVTAYDTLGEHGLLHSMVQTNTKAVFTDNTLLHTLINPLKKAKDIKYIICFEAIDPKDKRQGGKYYQNAKEAVDQILSIRPDIKVYNFDEILAMGEAAKDEIDPHPPKPKDLSCIMYTSGSTGDPKGVVLKQYNIIAGIAGIALNVEGYVTSKDRIICFLPLAHIFEMAFELLNFYWGSLLSYATVKTLSNTSVRNCKGDLAELKPTIMVGVAAVWETVRKGVLAKINKLPGYKRRIFWTAYHAKVSMKRYHIPGGDAVGNMVFGPIKEATGGCLRYVLNGGSRISIDAQQFITNLVCPMLIGYGLTETVANATILEPSAFQYGLAGTLTGAVTGKLVDVEELGYFAKNNQGELWLKGDSIMSEYYKNPEETANALTKDGWFQTGDVCEWTSDGQLRIVDRKKNLVKTQNGEYIALEKLESVYRSNPLVENICVYADQNKVKPVGILVPNVGPVTELAKKLGILKGSESVESYLRNPKLRKAILQELLKTGQSQGLGGIELLQGVVLFDGEWTPESGYITAAAKLKRKQILASVHDQVDEVYSS